MPANETAMNRPTTTRFTAKTFLRMLIGAILGAIVGYSAIAFAAKLGVSIKSLSWTDLLACWMGICFLSMGLVFGYLATNRKKLAASLEPACPELTGDTGEAMLATNQEVRTAQLQAWVLALAGILLLAPVLALGPMRSHPGIAMGVYAGIVLLFLVQTALNIHLWRTSDEFVQRAILIVCAATFAISQGLLFVYAAAERLHLVPNASSWDIFSLLMTCYILVNTYVSIRLRR